MCVSAFCAWSPGRTGPAGRFLVCRNMSGYEPAAAQRSDTDQMLITNRFNTDTKYSFCPAPVCFNQRSYGSKRATAGYLHQGSRVSSQDWYLWVCAAWLKWRGQLGLDVQTICKWSVVEYWFFLTPVLNQMKPTGVHLLIVCERVCVCTLMTTPIMGSVRMRPGWGVGQRSMSLQAVEQTHGTLSIGIWNHAPPPPPPPKQKQQAEK